MRWGRRILGWVWMASVAASTVLFVATVGMWGRSYWYRDEIMRATGVDKTTHVTAVVSENGTISVTRVIVLEFHGHAALTPAWHAEWTPLLNTVPGDDDHAWFRYEPLSKWSEVIDGSTTFGQKLTVSHWFFALLCLPLPLIAIRRWRKKRRIARDGLCPACGYDLRASVERCPECGTAIEVKHAVT